MFEDAPKQPKPQMEENKYGEMIEARPRDFIENKENESGSRNQNNESNLRFNFGSYAASNASARSIKEVPAHFLLHK